MLRALIAICIVILTGCAASGTRTTESVTIKPVEVRTSATMPVLSNLSLKPLGRVPYAFEFSENEQRSKLVGFLVTELTDDNQRIRSRIFADRLVAEKPDGNYAASFGDFMMQDNIYNLDGTPYSIKYRPQLPKEIPDPSISKSVWKKVYEGGYAAPRIYLIQAAHQQAFLPYTSGKVSDFSNLLPRDPSQIIDKVRQHVVPAMRRGNFVEDYLDDFYNTIRLVDNPNVTQKWFLGNYEEYSRKELVEGMYEDIIFSVQDFWKNIDFSTNTFSTYIDNLEYISVSINYVFSDSNGPATISGRNVTHIDPFNFALGNGLWCGGHELLLCNPPNNFGVSEAIWVAKLANKNPANYLPGNE